MNRRSFIRRCLGGAAALVAGALGGFAVAAPLISPGPPHGRIGGYDLDSYPKIDWGVPEDTYTVDFGSPVQSFVEDEVGNVSIVTERGAWRIENIDENTIRVAPVKYKGVRMIPDSPAWVRNRMGVYVDRHGSPIPPQATGAWSGMEGPR